MISQCWQCEKHINDDKLKLCCRSMCLPKRSTTMVLVSFHFSNYLIDSINFNALLSVDEIYKRTNFVTSKNQTIFERWDDFRKNETIQWMPIQFQNWSASIVYCVRCTHACVTVCSVEWIIIRMIPGKKDKKKRTTSNEY